ncbi:hypothetical protein BRD18_04995 [Halobacteriales archaeon SW_7_71_33]|nr:MAG: hypothetical protein BRD18_04995 [Halobacteriales archaeon SW_7_71_33]
MDEQVVLSDEGLVGGERHRPSLDRPLRLSGVGGRDPAAVGRCRRRQVAVRRAVDRGEQVTLVGRRSGRPPHPRGHGRRPVRRERRCGAELDRPPAVRRGDGDGDPGGSGPGRTPDEPGGQARSVRCPRERRRREDVPSRAERLGDRPPEVESGQRVLAGRDEVLRPVVRRLLGRRRRRPRRRVERRPVRGRVGPGAATAGQRRERAGRRREQPPAGRPRVLHGRLCESDDVGLAVAESVV